MINHINEVLSFPFVVDSFIPLILKIFIASLIVGGVVIISGALSYFIKNSVINGILSLIAVGACCIVVLEVLFLVILIAALPLLLCTIAVKMFLLNIITGIPEVVLGIIAAIICCIVGVLCSQGMLKSNTDQTKE